MSLLEHRPVVLITGISAAGKSTVADLLAMRFERGVHVRGDLFRRMVVAGRQEMTASPTSEAIQQLRLRYKLGVLTASIYHEAGFAVVVQDIILGPALADYVNDIHACPLIVVVLTPRPDVVEHREVGREKIAYREGFNDIGELDTALREATPRLGMWLDTSDQTPEQTVDMIVELGLERGLVS